MLEEQEKRLIDEYRRACEERDKNIGFIKNSPEYVNLTFTARTLQEIQYHEQAAYCLTLLLRIRELGLIECVAGKTGPWHMAY